MDGSEGILTSPKYARPQCIRDIEPTFLRDHLGSILAHVDDLLGTDLMSATNTEWFSYGAWGERRDADTWGYQAQPTTVAADSVTEHGFTGHEMLTETGLIHMNGRIFDRVLARFLSPDTFVQAPANGQSYNRYAYGWNNPLSITDPSGYIFGSLFKAIGNFVKKFWKPILAIAVSAALFVVLGPVGTQFGLGLLGNGTWAGIAAGAIAGAAGGAVTGGAKGALFGALSGAAAGMIGGALGDVQSIFSIDGFFHEMARAMVHGMSQGGLSELAGGEFSSGFIAGFSGSAFGSAMVKVPGMGKAGDFSDGRWALRTTAAATVSELSGGDFANGATTAAFVHLFNHEQIHESMFNTMVEKFDSGVVVNTKNSSAHGAGHTDITIGDDITGWNHYSYDDRNGGSLHINQFNEGRLYATAAEAFNLLKMEGYTGFTFHNVSSSRRGAMTFTVHSWSSIEYDLVGVITEARNCVCMVDEAMRLSGVQGWRDNWIPNLNFSANRDRSHFDASFQRARRNGGSLRWEYRQN